MPRKTKTEELREKFEEAVKKGLVSDSSAERTQALAQAGAMLTPALGELRSEIKSLTQQRDDAQTTLNKVTAERDQAQAILVIAVQSALQGSAAKAELAALKTDFDARIADARKELLDESTQKLWAAQRSENAATEKLQDAQRQFGARGQQILLDEVKRIFEENHISEPEDLAKLPAGISPLFLTLFGHSAVRAQLLIAYAKSFPEPSENFKQTLVRCLKSSLPVYEGMAQPDPIPDLAEKVAVLTAMATKWDVLADIQKIVEEAQIQRQADFLRTHYTELAAAQHASSLRGEGRTELNVQPQESVTGYQGECIDPEHCACPKHNGLPPRLRVDTWLGTRPTEKVEDINARHEVDTTLDYGRQLIERENLAKRGKLVTVLPPESVTLNGHHSLDDEGTL